LDDVPHLDQVNGQRNLAEHLVRASHRATNSELNANRPIERHFSNSANTLTIPIKKLRFRVTPPRNRYHRAALSSGLIRPGDRGAADRLRSDSRAKSNSEEAATRAGRHVPLIMQHAKVLIREAHSVRANQTAFIDDRSPGLCPHHRTRTFQRRHRTGQEARRDQGAAIFFFGRNTKSLSPLASPNRFRVCP